MLKSSRLGAYAFLAPSLLCLALIIGYPLVSAVSASLYRWNLMSGLHRWHGIGNYISILTDPATGQVAVVTVIYTVLSVVLELALGFGLALLIRQGLARKLMGFPLMRAILCLPVVIAPLIWAFYFRSIYSPQFGFFNIVLGWLGLSAVPWVNSPALALYSLVIADVWQWTPFMFAVILAGLLTLPGDVTEAARVDGASFRQILWRIELPLLQPVLLVAVLLRLIDALKNIDLFIVITQGGPGTSTEILNFYAFSTSFQDFQVGRGAALALIVFVIIMVLVMLLLASMRRFSRAESKA
ncbi:carbohydrate ABC transporter permease [Acidisoma silvae]|uniref:Sugar ABC transporter permease n=1 Tax=Acidisoma silvae TaxID=2802396 RepID=A0A963YW59_9PROT|nr:sugar ABC transporter permease [Acidisoma silvae]MCB8878081.1 sugar ABC transporter permease [Acidisoma silvae]